MENDYTIEEITKKVEAASTSFEKTNTDTKRKYLIWNIQTFNILASKVSVNKGSFGTGYPFYALDKNLEGTLPIIPEQLRYNRELVRDGKNLQKVKWLCQECLRKKYAEMPDLKTICKPCPNVADKFKPRKIINRLPDFDMWLVCKDGCIEQAQMELTPLLEKFNMRTSDIDPLLSFEDVSTISKILKDGKIPNIFLPIDPHIIEYSKLKELIENIPRILIEAEQDGKKPYLPIHPKSFRKQWQYDDEAYNFVYDFLSAFTSFNFPKELQESLDKSRKEVTYTYSCEELFEFLLASATKANFRRFNSLELEEYFFNKIEDWKSLDIKDQKPIVSENKYDLSHDDYAPFEL